MTSIKPSSRYNYFDTRSSTSSQFSDPSSSVELKLKQCTLERFVGGGGSGSRRKSPDALVKPKSSDLVKLNVKNEPNLSTMVKKFMEKRSSSSSKGKGNVQAVRNGGGLVPSICLRFWLLLRPWPMSSDSQMPRRLVPLPSELLSVVVVDPSPFPPI